VVERKGKNWESGEVTAPMFQSPCDPGLGDPPLFPPGIVGVLGSGLGKRRWLAGTKCVVQRDQLWQHHPVHTDAIEDEMVHSQVEAVVALGELDQARAQQRPAAQVIGCL
jgi:hypothetical protein